MSKHPLVFLGSVLVVVVVTILYVNVFRDRLANYQFVGNYAYTITDSAAFSDTYLSNSYGYVIGDLSVPGLAILSAGHLDPSE